MFLDILQQKNKNSYEENIKYITNFMYVYKICSKLKSSNILMIKMIAELCIEESIDYCLNSIFGIFDAIIKMQKKKLGTKILNEDCDPPGELNVWQVHQIFALVLLFDEYEEHLGFKLSELAIVKLWNNEQHNWTPDIIQRYGFLNIDLSKELKNRSIDFVHRTYAEFFVAQYLVNFIFADNELVLKEEIERKFKLFELF